MPTPKVLQLCAEQQVIVVLHWIAGDLSPSDAVVLILALLDYWPQQRSSMADTKKLVGERIKVLRKQAGLTQEQLAEQVGLDARHLSRLEVGRHFPSLDSLERIAEKLNQPLAEFFQFPTNETPADLRDYLIRFAEGANNVQLQLAVKAIKLVVS
jgi:transcriptional regulator with XRE-family HTH domain